MIYVVLVHTTNPGKLDAYSVEGLFGSRRSARKHARKLCKDFGICEYPPKHSPVRVLTRKVSAPAGQPSPGIVWEWAG